MTLSHNPIHAKKFGKTIHKKKIHCVCIQKTFITKTPVFISYVHIYTYIKDLPSNITNIPFNLCHISDNKFLCVNVANICFSILFDVNCTSLIFLLFTHSFTCKVDKKVKFSPFSMNKTKSDNSTISKIYCWVLLLQLHSVIVNHFSLEEFTEMINKCFKTYKTVLKAGSVS